MGSETHSTPAAKGYSLSSLAFLRTRLRASASFTRRLSPGFK